MKSAASASLNNSHAQGLHPEKVKILAVDDDRDNLLALQAILEPLQQDLMLAESGTDALLTGRSEGFVVGRPDLEETMRRLQAYAEAGAECLYAPGIGTAEQVSAVVAAVAPKPVNLLANAPFITVAEAAGLGVRRISVGGTLARTAWAGFLAAAEEIAADGTFSRFAGLPDVDAVFGR